jgi:hypothetical protein
MHHNLRMVNKLFMYRLDFCKLLNSSPLSHWERVRVRDF